MKDATVDEGHTQEGVVELFAGFLKVLETGVVGGILDGDRADLLGDQAGQAFAEGHAQGSDTARVEAKGGGQDEVGLRSGSRR